MFIVPLLVAIIFTMLSYTELKSEKADVGGVFAMMVASVTWFIFGLTWPAVATSDMFQSVAYLWYAFGIIFAVLAVYTGLKMMGVIFQKEIKPMLTMEADDEDDD